MVVVLERDALEQVVWEFGCHKLRLQQLIQDWVQEQERLMEHAVRLCPGGRAALENAQMHHWPFCANHGQTFEIPQWPQHNVASQNLHNPSCQASELEYNMHHSASASASAAVAREHARLSTKALEPPMEVFTLPEHRPVSFGDSQRSELHDDIGSERLGVRNVTQSSAKWPLQSSANHKLDNLYCQKPELEYFRQPSADEAMGREPSHSSTIVAQASKHQFTSPKQRHPTFEDSQPPSLRGSESQETYPKTKSSEPPSAPISPTRSLHSAIGLSRNDKKALTISDLEGTRITRLYKVMGKSLYSDAPVSSPGARCGCMPLVTYIVTSGHFESFCAVVIFANSVVMGISADYAMNNLNGPDNESLEQMELFFSIFYTVEVCLRIVVYGRIFFTGNFWKWNLFDVALIVLSAYDRVHSVVVPKATSQGQNLAIFRVSRLFKMLRLLRVFRLMKFFRELRLILAALHGSMQVMVWAGVLIALITYVVAIGLLHGCAGHLEEDQVDVNTERSIGEHWGSVGRSMISLFMCTTGGEDWAKLAAPLEDVGTFFYALFLAYVFFFLLALMNTITSLFVDSIVETSTRDKQMAVQQELEKKQQYIQQLKSFFEKVDEDKDGVVSYADFLKNSDDPVLEAFAASLDLDITSSKLFFKIISNDGAKDVDLDTFVVGCIKLKGHARNMDLIDLIHTTKNAAARQDALGEEVLRQIRKLTATLSKAGGGHSSLGKQGSANFTAVQGAPLLHGMRNLQKRIDDLIQHQSTIVTSSSRMERLHLQASGEQLIKDVMVDGHGAAQDHCGSKAVLQPTGRQTQPRTDETLTPRIIFGNSPRSSNAPGFSAGGVKNARSKRTADTQRTSKSNASDNAFIDLDGPSADGRICSPRLGQQQWGQT